MHTNESSTEGDALCIWLPFDLSGMNADADDYRTR